MSEAAFGVLETVGDSDPWAAEHVARVVAWLASDHAGDVSGNVLVVAGGRVELLSRWASANVVDGGTGLDDTALETLGDRLFADLPSRQEPAVIGALFTSSDRFDTGSPVGGA
jgi:hypothetical protein